MAGHLHGQAASDRGECTLETRFAELKRYVSFTDADARLLAAFRPLAEPHFVRIAQEFYDRIREHEEAHAIFTGEAQIGRLQRSLQRWMHRLLSGRYDEAYFDETLHIGHVHVKVGLPQRYMFSAMALIRVELTRLVEQTVRDQATATREALTRLLDIELGIMLEGYREDFVSRVQRLERLEKQELNRALVQTEHRYVNAVELARVMIVGLDTRGEVRLFNRESERVTGFARDEVLGRTIDVILQEDRVDTRGAEMRRAAAGDRLAHDVIECAVRTKSGKYRDVRWQLAYAPSETDAEVVLFVIGQDITAELALKEKTVQHEKLAAVGTLAAGLAHEIRNPLNGAQLHVSFLERTLKRTAANEEALDAVRVVGDEIKRLAALVTEFLDFARPRPPQIKPTTVRALCERAITLVSQKAADASISLTLDFPSRDPTLQVDPAKIEQVLLNLLTNAIEAVGAAPLSPGSPGHVTLRVRRQPRSVFFEVEDNGPGLPSVDAPIFDPFFSTKAEGTGLGLAITHRIVTDHGGDIVVETAPRCTIFRVTLPLESEPAA